MADAEIRREPHTVAYGDEATHTTFGKVLVEDCYNGMVTGRAFAWIRVFDKRSVTMHVVLQSQLTKIG